MPPGIEAAARGEVREIRPTNSTGGEATTPLGANGGVDPAHHGLGSGGSGILHVSHRNAALGVFLTDCDARQVRTVVLDLQAQSAFGTGRVVAKRRTP